MEIILGKLKLSEKPEIVAVIDKLLPIEHIEKLKKKNVNILEWRVDLISEPIEKIKEHISIVRTLNLFSFILTIRCNNIEDMKINYFAHEELLDFSDAVDIDLNTPNRDELIKLVKANKKSLVISHHDYEKMLSEKELTEVINQAENLNADIIKIAVTPKTNKEVIALLSFTEKNKHKNIVIIGMGQIAKVTRAIAPLFGSLWTYGCLEDEVAPGQLTVKKLSDLYQSFPLP
jgi:3-dehydroquinate dehydratase I